MLIKDMHAPLEHDHDMTCPHCVISMMVNGWLASADAPQFVQMHREMSPRPDMSDEELAMAGIVAAIGVAAARLIFKQPRKSTMVALADHFLAVYGKEVGDLTLARQSLEQG